MTEFKDFSDSIAANTQPNREWVECLQALWWAQKGNWEKAHDIAQVGDEIVERTCGDDSGCPTGYVCVDSKNAGHTNVKEKDEKKLH